MMQQATHMSSQSNHASHNGNHVFQGSGNGQLSSSPESKEERPRKRKSSSGDDDSKPEDAEESSQKVASGGGVPQPSSEFHQQHGMPTSFPFGVMPSGYLPMPSQPPQHQGSMSQSPPPGSGPRVLNGSKRAEQNRKAQRAFRERRDAHVKALESRSQLLDAALASVEEANRRWEESRLIVDSLRIENAQLRAALNAFQQAGAAVHQQIMAQQQQQATEADDVTKKKKADEKESSA